MTAEDWTPERRQALHDLCDTFIPAVRPPDVEADDPTGFWSRRASDLDVAERVAEYLAERVGPEDRAGMLELLDALHRIRFGALPQVLREGALKALARASEPAADGIDAYRGLALAYYYGDARGGAGNPNWEQMGYPGPPDVEPAEPPPISPLRPTSVPVELDAEIVVVGSGSGGGVVAGVLAGDGHDVLVIEAGGHHDASNFPRDELSALRDLYWRGGSQDTSDGMVTMLAGATLGGGSTINWMNCVPPPGHVREHWARDHGLKGLDGADFDEHLDAVLTRICATRDATELNGPNQRLAEGADALGWSWHRATRNVDLDAHTPGSAGHVGFGDRTGAKQGTLRTYLADAARAGARFLVDCQADRITTRSGRVTGVTATLTTESGETVPVIVRAKQVVVACGALETPALLLRSGIGGTAVGRYLRLHPVPNIPGFYPAAQDAWWGPPQASVVDEHAAVAEGHGYLIETPHLHPALAAAGTPWRSGRDHKLIMGRGAHLAIFLAVVRERGSGRVTLDAAGEAVVTYPLDEAFDRDLIARALGDMVRLHAAAGATAIIDLHPRRDLWRRSDDLDAFIDRIRGLDLGRRGRPLFSAHQMGTARMGTDVMSSVADPDGQLHDVPGVWIGDTSAFPTAVGSNPMITCMALARRTAHAILATG